MDSLLEWFLGTPLKIAVVVLLSVILRALLIRGSSRLIKRALLLRDQRHLGKDKTSEQALAESRHAQRADSISSLLRSVISITVYSLSGIMVLSNLGIDVGPILASAGVVGVALGFGAQTLVKDFIAGIFMILEDQYGVGDVIDVGPAMGTVEEIGLRVTRLRDKDGTVWYMRNGEVLRIANHSQ
jgi:small conductance mechanosensitive channel